MPGNAEIGEAVGRTGPWVTKWAASDTPPRDFEVHAPMARFLGVDELWLFRSAGDAPEPELWAVWEMFGVERAAALQRRTQPTAATGSQALRVADAEPTYKRVAREHGLGIAEKAITGPSDKNVHAKESGRSAAAGKKRR